MLDADALAAGEESISVIRQFLSLNFALDSTFPSGTILWFGSGQVAKLRIDVVLGGYGNCSMHLKRHKLFPMDSSFSPAADRVVMPTSLQPSDSYRFLVADTSDSSVFWAE